mmetsp:Transcript_10389/g.13160  ORF Transcript_10389/g.13160 Transcript_10389/m.13160 type:complete len:507 (-) Transcript_10389:84-1604(-)
MGQCSTLPADGNKNGNSSSQTPTTSTGTHSKQRSSYTRSGSSSTSKKQQREQRDSAYHGRPSDDERHNDGDAVMTDAYEAHSSASGRSRDVNKLLNVAKNGNHKFDQFLNEDEKSNHSSTHHSSKSGRSSRSRSHAAPSREEVLPPPPPGSVRTRCYRLNLDAPVILSPTHDHLGPMPYEPPSHLLPSRSRQITESLSSESMERNPTDVAVSTARIFRGITVDKNGTILSQNARATRSSRGKEKQKQAASSRQQEKINKAKDLVDEAVGTGKENDREKSNMVSLVIIGEYDEMKQLVRDGAKKLRDAEGLPDEALLAINRPRQNSQYNSRVRGNGREAMSPASLGSSSSRKRFSSPSKSQTSNEFPDNKSRSKNRLQQSIQSAPPKIKSHPRDRPSARRLGSGTGDGSDDRSGRFNTSEKCNDSIFGGVDSDWSEALGFSRGFDSIWNCGATGKDTGSPNNKSGSTRSSSSKVRYEGRNESSARYSRGGGMTAQRDAPVSKDVMIL